MPISPLTFRRQFLVGPRFIDQFTGWKNIKASDTMCITAHPDLPVTQVSHNNAMLTLLGFVFDPYHPEADNQTIAQQLVQQATGFSGIIQNTESLSGRWVILYDKDNDLHCFHDPCGLRQVYYTRHENENWVGSQPSIIIEATGMPVQKDPAAVAFMQSPQYEKLERFWPGDGTLYREIHHLLPNHALNIATGTSKRFFPVEPIAKQTLEEAVPVAAALLKGSLVAAANRYELLLPVTAGWDSRVLYAASKDVKDNTVYYIHQLEHLQEGNRDIIIPRRMLASAGLAFNVVPARTAMDPAFRKIFEQNVTHARSHLAKALGIFANYNRFNGKLNITGNGGEIARCYYYYFHHHKKPDAKTLARISKYDGIPYVISAFEKTLTDTTPAAAGSNISLFDLLYWEQRMGNWGSMYPAEQDIAVEEFSPFNNRKLLITMLSVNRKYRMPPTYTLFRKITEALWPEALNEPVNPQPFKSWLKEEIKKVYFRLFY